ncbi:MAG TPA: hypothetical protein ENK85_10365 [Saprospiraceae bacterium]|nr:hypothetical protein [Saprospiraceae bacterium]
MSVSYNGYDAQTINYPNFRPRYESNIVALNAGYNLQLGKYFSLGFGAHISNRKKSYSLPEIPNENLVSYIQNPRNNIHIDPKYKWIQLHLGAHMPQYSNLTSGDIQIFGAGVELTPGRFILSANYGKTQTAIEPDSIFNIQGMYQRKLLAGRIGFGHVEGSKFTINVVKIKDDPFSVINQPIGLKPVDALTVSPLIQFKLGKKITIKTETAGSVYTQNTLADTIEIPIPEVATLSQFVSLNATSRMDYAHQSTIDYKGKNFKIGGEVKLIGPGFSPAGYFAMEQDLLDYKINTAFNLLKNKIQLNGSFGIRTNNISQTNILPTQKLIGAGAANIKFSKKFSVRANYSNFGMTNNDNNLYQRVEFVQQSISLAPSYRFQSDAIKHRISLNWRMGSYKQYDIQILDYADRTSTNYSANYRMKFKNKPLTIRYSGLYLTNNSPTINFKLWNVGMQIGYKLFNKKLNPKLSINYSKISRGIYTPDSRIRTKLNLKYKMGKKRDLKFGYSLNVNQYGSYRPNAKLTEHKFQATISQKF